MSQREPGWDRRRDHGPPDEEALPAIAACGSARVVCRMVLDTFREQRSRLSNTEFMSWVFTTVVVSNSWVISLIRLSITMDVRGSRPLLGSSVPVHATGTLAGGA